MINTTTFTNWPDKGTAGLPFWNHSSPNLRLILAEVRAMFPGTADLGCYGVRPTRSNSSVLSTHSYGAAQDISYRGLGSTVAARRSAAAPIIAWLIDHSLELGIQAVHDYLNSRIWRSSRAGTGDGWKAQAKDAGGMGQTWGDWVHVETTEASWNDQTPIASRLDTAVIVAPRPVLFPGCPSSPLIGAVQTILRTGANQDVTTDNQFGNQTLAAWRNYVAYVAATSPGQITEDDFVDTIDWNVLAWTDQGWQRLYASGFPVGA